MKRVSFIIIGLAWLVLPLRAAEPTPEGIEFFERKVRPLLVEHCQRCHGGSKQKANLALDSLAALRKGGDSGPAIVAGQPAASLLIKAISYEEELRMPPRGKLTDAQIADLTAWIKMGAPWPDDPATKTTKIAAFNLAERKKFWCWQPLSNPPVPKAGAWARNAIDAFILAKLEEKGLTPAPPAEPRVLLRRLYFDLIGLPPTPAEVDDFVKQYDATGQRAVEQVVDRLLASPHYGERWGRHWLDLVRFAETHGHEFDFEIPHAYEYRDYVIRAFNNDVPYSQLVLEHVAGDLLPRPRRHPGEHFNESILGTGFWFLGEGKHSPVDIRAEEADRLDNQIDVFSKTFLGLTISCARCHDHKFDAITTKDFYSLYGFLSSSRYQRAFIDDPAKTAASLRELRDLRGRIAALAKQQIKAPVEANQAFPALTPLLAADAAPAEVFAARRRQLMDKLRGDAAKRIPLEGFRQPAFGDWSATGDAFGAGPSQGEWLDGIVPPGQAHSGLTSAKLRGVLRSPTFTIAQKKVLFRVAGQGGKVNLIIDNFQLIRNPIYGGLAFPISKDKPSWHAMDVSMWVGHKAYIEVIDDSDGQVMLERVLLSDDGPPADSLTLELALLADPAVKTQADLVRRARDLQTDIIAQWQADRLAEQPDAADRAALLNRLPREASPDHAALLNQFRAVEAKLPTPRRGLAMLDGPGQDERVFIRGNHKNLGEIAPRQFLEALSAGLGAAPTGPGSGRLELAQRLIDPANPLVARVMVNRIWQHHFGKGLVKSVDNFGVLGEPPTHPELLDYLASNFMREQTPVADTPGSPAWSIKKMHRLMLLSSTYQMASVGDAKAAELDPQNRLLHQMPIRRLEAEAIRDAILTVSGRLDRKLYGPSVLPNLTEHMSGRGRPASGPLDGNGRRSLYVNVRRNFLSPMFLAFDYPIPFTTIGQRSVSNVPAQALTLLNNPFVLQQAQRWGQHMATTAGSPGDRVTLMYQTAFARPPSQTELADALAFLDGRAADPTAWSDLAHVLFNVKEFIFIN